MKTPQRTASLLPILTTELRMEHDVVLARQNARHVAELLGFDMQDQTRIATSVSEIARNAYQYAGGGRVEILAERGPVQSLVVRVRDEGPGVEDLRSILDGRYKSPTGMGRGIAGSRRLMDSFEIQSAPGEGTVVTFSKTLPPRAQELTPALLAHVSGELARNAVGTPLGELQRQNQELLRALEELRQRQEDLARLNRELEDTNRGVVALYAELDERATYLRRVSELKSRYLSNMSHEFRTPLNSILSLARLLLDRIDGNLSAEQEKQVTFIRRSAEELSELVNDLLDLAKAEAGKIPVRPAPFEAADLFGALRGVLKPLTEASNVALIFEEPAGVPPLRTDESKVSQILRNFVSNALKFTREGEVRVSATAGPEGVVVFAVSDTGIGIAPEDQELIFEEFSQVDNPIQKAVKGTGLGLPLSRKLAELLGGQVWVESRPGCGSTFFAAIPLEYRGAVHSGAPQQGRVLDSARLPVLVIEDRADTALAYQKALDGTEFQAVAVRSVKEARRALREIRPAAIILDILLEGDTTWHLLEELKRDRETAGIPVLVISMIGDPDRALSLGADLFHGKPVDGVWLLENLRRLAVRTEPVRVLLIDDDEISRYVLRSQLARSSWSVTEAAGGEEGLRLARELRPQAIFLDLAMPDLDGFQVLERLKDDPATNAIPVIINTSMSLSPERQQELSSRTACVLRKGSFGDAPASILKEVLAALAPGARPK